MTLPKGHLSPSQLGQFQRCEVQWSIFTLGGAKAPPDFALESKKLTHEILLEDDLAYKQLTGSNRANSELLELHRAKMESAILPLAKEDPNLEGTPEKAVTSEVEYFGKIVDATNDYRRAAVPVEVEATREFTIGGVPIECRIDLVREPFALETKGARRIEDLKRLGQAPAAGSAGKSRQLVTYAIAENLREVGFAAVVENKTPKLVLEQGTVSDGEIARVTRQYQIAMRQMEQAMRTGDFMPVDHGEKQKAWVCSARYCAAWKIGARAWNTGQLIECKWGERSEVRA